MFPPYIVLSLYFEKSKLPDNPRNTPFENLKVWKEYYVNEPNSENLTQRKNYSTYTMRHNYSKESLSKLRFYHWIPFV